MDRISPLIHRIRSHPMVDRVLSRRDTIPENELPGSSQKTLSPLDENTMTTSSTQQSWDMGGRYVPSRYVQARQLGRLDPSLYLSEEGEELYDILPGHLGRIWFTVAYFAASEMLKITVHKARNLRQSLLSRGASFSLAGSEQISAQHDDGYAQDFRIKVYLEQAERKCHMTSIKKQTVNPNFNEHFCFQVSAHDANQQILRFEVLGIDRRRRGKVIGYATFNLSLVSKPQQQQQQQPENSSGLRVFRDIQLDTDDEVSANPYLLVALTHFPTTERLIVGLFGCKNLPLRENGLPVDVYAKVVVYQGLQGKESKTRRTDILGTRDSFDESFVFQKIPDPANVHVRITMLQQAFIDKQLGFVVLGGEMVSKGRGVEQWKTMIEQPEEQFCEWHELQPF